MSPLKAIWREKGEDQDVSVWGGGGETLKEICKRRNRRLVRKDQKI